MLVQQRCEILAEVLKSCLDEERLLLESIPSDVTTFVFQLVTPKLHLVSSEQNRDVGLEEGEY